MDLLGCQKNYHFQLKGVAINGGQSEIDKDLTTNYKSGTNHSISSLFSYNYRYNGYIGPELKEIW